MIAAAFAGLAAIFILWTQSRGAALVAVVGLVLFFRARLGQALFTAVAVGIVFFMFLEIFDVNLPGLGRFSSTLNTRSHSWGGLWAVFLANPLIGNGTDGTPENSYLSALAICGVIGTIPLAISLALVARSLVRLQRIRRTLGEHSQLADLVVACIVSMLITCVFEAFLLGTLTDFVFCFFVLLAVAAFLSDPALLSVVNYQEGRSEWGLSDGGAATWDSSGYADAGHVLTHESYWPQY